MCGDGVIKLYLGADEVTFARSVQVLIVGVEHAVMPEFQQHLVHLESAEKLGRIVLDECHVVVTQRSFRGVVRRLGGVLRCVDVPLVLLTATLPVEMEERVRFVLGCEKLRIIRSCEERKELRYSVHDVTRSVAPMRDLNREIGKLLRVEMVTWDEDDRGIVYCLQRKWAENLAEYVNEKWGEEICGVYHSDMDRKERERMLLGWKRGEYLWLAATSALSVGIDYQEVRMVIHQGFGRSMIDYRVRS